MWVTHPGVLCLFVCFLTCVLGMELRASFCPYNTFLPELILLTPTKPRRFWLRLIYPKPPTTVNCGSSFPTLPWCCSDFCLLVSALLHHGSLCLPLAGLSSLEDGSLLQGIIFFIFFISHSLLLIVKMQRLLTHQTGCDLAFNPLWCFSENKNTLIYMKSNFWSFSILQIKLLCCT